MNLDISSLFENGYLDEGNEGSLMGAPETSKMAVGTVYDDAKLRFDFELTEEFNPSNYLKLGFCQYKVISGLSGLPSERNIYAEPEENLSYFITIPISEELLNKKKFVVDEDNYNSGKKIPGAYTVYGYAQSENGLYYPIKNGSPLKFWFSKSSVDVVDVTKNTVIVKISSLEQPISKENYQAVGVTTEPFVQGEKTLKNENGDLLRYSETEIDFQSENDSFYMILRGLAPNTTVKGYIYKKNFVGRYYMLGYISAKTKTEEIPKCFLDVLWYDEPFSRKDGNVTGYIVNCPHISVSAYRQFCTDINTVRTKCEMPEYGDFITVNSGEEMSYSVFEHLYYAIIAIYINKNGLEWDDSFPSVAPTKSGFAITREFIEGLVSALIKARNYFFNIQEGT